MQTLTQEELNIILDNHELWLKTNGEQGERARLSFKYLSNRDLFGADLFGADLFGADLSGADLFGADLFGADLFGADLFGADLRYAIASGIIGKQIISVQVDTSRKNNTINYWSDFDIITTGCFQGTLNELKEQVKITHKDNTVLRERYERAINYIEETVNDYKENNVCKN